MAKALTQKSIDAIKPGSSRREIPDGQVPGLYLIVQPNGKKSWAVRYRVRGQSRKLTLGPLEVLDLSDARAQARISLADVAKGQDPILLRKIEAANEGIRFRTVYEQFIARQALKNRPGYIKETKRLFEREVLPYWRDRNIQEITKKDVLKLIDAIAKAGHGTTANRVLAALRALFNWCIERDILAVTPVNGLKPLSPERQRDRILTPDELRCFWQATGKQGHPFGPLFRLLLLTGQRVSEVAGMDASEVQGRLWTIPKERTKNGKEHHVPLSDAALEVLDTLPTEGKLFIGRTGKTTASGFSRAKDILDREIAAICGPIPHFILHDLRRTAASGMASLGISPHVVEAVLNHTSGTIKGVAAVYNRYNYSLEKQKALAAWGNYIELLATGSPMPVSPPYLEYRNGEN